jgi:hypothetical protein
MKIREGFVSNSSSASFVIAIRKDCTLEDFKSYCSKDIKLFIDQYREYIDTEDIPLDQSTQDYITNRLYNLFKNEKYGIVNLDNWLAYSRNISSEDTGLFDLFLYSVAALNYEKLKISSYT